ncbi:hypothetical protein FG386_000103 [Cryptosporidium ryanae]|uniref:uncharacterized protein n=1 Tax=Cryptosporidium ryanae TaxID=515981 RepID=UPI00351A809C|nr:hypothetical protein FG386_000103 [Cryptosporidium ryanae]
MNNTFNSWTSGIVNFLNMGKNQRENVTDESNMTNVTNEIPPFLNRQGNMNRFIPFQNLQGYSQNGPFPHGNQMGEYNGNGIITQVDYTQYSPSIPNFTTAAYTSISGIKQIVSITDIGNVVAHYYDLGKYVGNGGAIRFFLLCKQIKHSFINIPLKDEKIDVKNYSPMLSVMDSGFSFPLLIHNNKYHLYGTSSTLRYIAKKIGEYGIDTYRDYILDVFSEYLLEWRNSLLLAILESIIKKENVELQSEESNIFLYNVNNIKNEIIKTFKNYSDLSRIDSETMDENDDCINKYFENRRKYFELIESILVLNNSNPFIPLKGDMLNNPKSNNEIPMQLCNSPSYSELFLFSILYDDSILINENVLENSESQPSTDKLLKEFPKINNLFNAIMSYPLITQWHKEVEESENVDGEKGFPSSNNTSKSKMTNNVTTNTTSTATMTNMDINVIQTGEANMYLGNGRAIDSKGGKDNFEYGVNGYNSHDGVLLNEPHTTNTITYKLAPPKSQVIFPNSGNSNNQMDELTNNIYTNSMGSVNLINKNTFNAIRINNYEPTFRPSNPQPSVNVRIANFSQLDNYRHQIGQEQKMSSSRHFGNYNKDTRQNNQNYYPNYIPSTYR